MLPSATVMLASCVSPSTYWPITWSGPNDCKRTPIWWAVKWCFIHYYAQLIYFSLNSRTIVSYSDLSTLDINPFPYWLLLSSHSFTFFFLSCLLDSKVSLSEHDSTLTLCLGRGLSRTSHIPVKRLLQQVRGIMLFCRTKVFRLFNASSLEQPVLVPDLEVGGPAFGRGAGTWWSLWSLPTQAILWFFSMISDMEMQNMTLVTSETMIRATSRSISDNNNVNMLLTFQAFNLKCKSLTVKDNFKKVSCQCRLAWNCSFSLLESICISVHTNSFFLFQCPLVLIEDLITNYEYAGNAYQEPRAFEMNEISS